MTWRIRQKVQDSVEQSLTLLLKLVFLGWNPSTLNRAMAVSKGFVLREPSQSFRCGRFVSGTRTCRQLSSQLKVCMHSVSFAIPEKSPSIMRMAQRRSKARVMMDGEIAIVYAPSRSIIQH
jgi:hypothetical protein